MNVKVMWQINTCMSLPSSKEYVISVADIYITSKTANYFIDEDMNWSQEWQQNKISMMMMINYFLRSNYLYMLVAGDITADNFWLRK